ncbi:MAG: helix-turn-helix domain-containing protein, partial [Butyricicoccus sp.]|nr:helix-turn-helix domain-containing protein [Butyricicoccus sp.]
MLDFSVVYPKEDGIHWEKDYQIVYVLRGAVEICVEMQVYTMQSEDFLVINPFSPFWIQQQEGAILLRMRCATAWLMQLSENAAHRRIDCFSAAPDILQPDAIDHLRRIYANLFAIYSRERQDSHLRSASKALLLFDQLFSAFGEYEARPEKGRKIKKLNIVQGCLQYIQKHFRQWIRPEDIAQMLGISANYLSRCLRECVGMTFTEIVQQFRMQHALKELEYSNRAVTEIAYDSGFTSPSAFISKFREIYGQTPRVYRKQHNAAKTEQKQLDIGESIYQNISKYIDQTIEPLPDKPVQRKIMRISCSVAQTKDPIDFHWKQVASISWAGDGLSAQVQQQIRIAQKEIGFSYLRFHGIFGDDMLLYDEDEAGNPIFNFIYV